MTCNFNKLKGDVSSMKTIPEEGFVRISQIVGNKTSPGVIPISKSSWWSGVRKGIFPQPVKLGKRTTVWRVADIRRLIDESNGHE
jgi:predicted DNA-binding transcriptional regulator AlpA